MVYRGGLASRLYHIVSTNYIFVGAVPRLSLQIDWLRRLQNRFVGASVVPVAPIIPACRDGTVHFFEKKIQIYNSNSTKTYIYAYIIQI